MKIKNIIFDFDGVLIRNSKLLLETHRETLCWISDEEHYQVFDGNTSEFLKRYKKEEMEFFWKKWKKLLENELVEKIAKEFLLKNSDKNFYIISSNSENILNKILENSNLEKNLREFWEKKHTLQR